MATSKALSEFGSGASSGSERAAPPSLAATITTSATSIAAVLADGGGPADRDDWLNLVGRCQTLINTLTAVQDNALAEAARRETDWLEDGTLGETVHGRGRITLDAADLAAPALGASHPQAQRRVELAVRLADGREPVPAEHQGVPDKTGLRGLHAAMAQGRLDGYRASVVAFELDMAPADVADAVIAALEPHLCDDAPTLRQRTRRLLARISPDLLRQRAARARASSGLRRWVAEPGVDTWVGTFPSEDAAAAWAVLDQRAHELVAEGSCSTVEQARGKALTDLVTGNARVDVQVVLTVPAEVMENGRDGHLDPEHSDREHSEPEPSDRVPSDRVPSEPEHSKPQPGSLDHGALDQGHPQHRRPAATWASSDRALEEPALPEQDETGDTGDDDLIQVQGARPSEPLLVRRGWLREHLSERPRPPGHGNSIRSQAHATTVNPARAATPSPPNITSRDLSTPTSSGQPDVATGDHGNTTSPDRPGVTPRNSSSPSPPDQPNVPSGSPGGTTSADRPDATTLDPSSAARHGRHDLSASQRGGSPTRPGGSSSAPTTRVPCDPSTGARLDAHDDLATAAYRPGAQLIALVKARDGRCRFPGCRVAARFCDLDHVRPWPTGPTSARNLLCLCRRHHRIKQRPGWQVRLAADGTATWIDPAGRSRTTAPLDALLVVVLARPSPAAPSAGAGAPVDPAVWAAQASTPLTAAHDTASGPASRVDVEATSLPSRSSGDLRSTEPSQNLEEWSALETLMQIHLEHRVAGVHLVEPRLRIAVAPATNGHRRCTSSAALRAASERRRAAAAAAIPPPF